MDVHAKAAEIAVIAGTPYDARLGADLLRAKGILASPHPMASSPDEQDSLQYLSPDGLQASFLDQLRELESRGITMALLFCNSISAVLDHDAIAKASPVKLISPITVYRQLSNSFANTMVVTGNGQAVVGFERTVLKASAKHRVLGVSDPALVRAIENGDPAAAFRASHLRITLRLAERLELDAVVLACTHFTSILPFVQAACEVPVVDVGTSLIALTWLTADASLAGQRV